MNGWIGVDLDGTLAHYDGWQGAEHIGPPVEVMANRVRIWRAAGIEVRIFTARVHRGAGTHPPEGVVEAIEAWCLEHLHEVLPITNEKDYGMVELWDDRCVQVEANTGRRMDGVPESAPGPA